MASNRTRRIAKEIADIHSDQHSKIVVEPSDNADDLTHLRGQFLGPPDTPYEGATYFVDIKIPSEYPFRPPVMKFETKIWHPNVSSQTVNRCAFLQNSSRLTNTGRHMLRHTIITMVTSPDHQVRSHFAPISPQHTRAKGSTRRRSSQHADSQSR